MKYSKFIVLFVILLNILFAGIVLTMFWRTGYEPTALIAAWFAFTTGELWALSRIKVREEGRKRYETYPSESPFYEKSSKEKGYK